MAFYLEVIIDQTGQSYKRLPPPSSLKLQNFDFCPAFVDVWTAMWIDMLTGAGLGAAAVLAGEFEQK